MTLCQLLSADGKLSCVRGVTQLAKAALGGFEWVLSLVVLLPRVLFRASFHAISARSGVDSCSVLLAELHILLSLPVISFYAVRRVEPDLSWVSLKHRARVCAMAAYPSELGHTPVATELNCNSTHVSPIDGIWVDPFCIV
jgi:hypothetical protein